MHCEFIYKYRDNNSIHQLANNKIGGRGSKSSEMNLGAKFGNCKPNNCLSSKYLKKSIFSRKKKTKITGTYYK